MKPSLFGLDGARLPHGRFLQERTWNFWEDGDQSANGLVASPDTTGTVTVPSRSSGDSKPNRAVLTTAATNNDAVRLYTPNFVSHRYSAIEFSVARLALDPVNPSDVQIGLSNHSSYNAGVILQRTYATSVGTRQAWVVSERANAGGPFNETTKILTYASAPCNNLTVLWFPAAKWLFVLDGDAVLHSQETPDASDGTIRAYVRVIARSAAAAICEVSQMRLKLWHNV